MKWSRCLALLAFAAAAANCGGDATSPKGPPTVTAVSPASAVQGTALTVSVTGTNFDTHVTPGMTIAGGGITVSDISVTSTTAATAHVEIAADAPVGPRILTMTGAGSGATFTVLAAAPTLTALSAATAVEGATVTLTLTGTNFLSGATTVAVSGSGVTVSGVTVASPTSLTATLAVAATADIGARQVTVTTAGGTSAAQTLTINPPVPVLASIAPVSGLIGTTVSVTFTGTGFVPGATTINVSGSGVTVGSATVGSLLDRAWASVQSLVSEAAVTGTATTLTATFAIAPDAALGARTVTITTAGGTSAAQTFTVGAPAAAIATFTATPAKATLGAPVTLSWSGITNGTTCAIDNGVGTVSCTGGTTSVTPAVATTYTLTATGPGGTGTAQAFVTFAAPSIASFSLVPGSVVAGGLSTLMWTGIANATSCVIDQGVGVVPCVNGSAGVVASKTVNITLKATGPGGVDSATVTLNVVPGIQIGSFSASPATIGRGSASTLSWTALSGAASCAIDNGVGSVPCASGNISVSPVATTTYTLTATGALGNTLTGTASVTVIQPPALASVAPVKGVQGTTQAVTLTGTNFVTGATTLALSGGSDVTVSNVNVTSATTLTADLAIGATAVLGARTVTITTLGGTTAPQTFTINPPPPTLAGVAPVKGVQGTTQAVTLTGTNFVAGATTVVVSGGADVTVSNVNVMSATTLTADFAIGGTAVLGARTVMVTTAGGNTGTQPFTVNPPAPTLASVTPNQGAQNGAQTVTLSGTNFIAGATTVTVAGTGVTVSGVNVANANTLTATFTVDPTATLGARDVTVTTAGGPSGAQPFSVIVGPTINSFAALSTHVTVVQPATLQWTTSNAAACAVGSIGSVPCSSSAVVTPGSTTTYTLQASSAGATASATATIFANEPGRWVFSTANLDNQLQMFSLDATSGNLTPITGSPVAAGNKPIDVTVDPSGAYAYAVNNAGNTVSMYTINATTGALATNGTIAAGTGARSIAVDPTGRFAYVVNQAAGTVSAYTINGSGQLVANGAAIAAGSQPLDLAIDPLTRFVYVTNFSDHNIEIYSINANGTLTTIGTQAIGGISGPFGVAVDPAGRFLYATTQSGGAVQPFTIASNGTLTPGTAVAGSGTMTAIAADPTGRFVYAIDGNNSFLWAYRINQTTGALTAVAAPATGALPSDVAIDPQGKFVYTSNANGTISIFPIDQTTGAVAGRTDVAAGNSPHGLVVSR